MTPVENRTIGLRDSWIILLIWIMTSSVQLWLNRSFLGSANFPDTDDALRLVQIREWLAGQSWFDVTQYRVAPPAGVAMHWSRLADIPVAALILLFSAALRQGQAEAASVALAPLLLHLLFLSGVFLLTLRMTGQRRIAIVACVICALAPGIGVQFRPLRIDHHALQIVLMVLATASMIGPARNGRAAAIAGVMAAAALVVSIENLPVTAAMIAVLTSRYLRDPGRLPDLAGFAAGLSIGSAALLLLTQKLGWITSPHCDALSAPHVWPAAAFAVSILGGSRIAPGGAPRHRLLIVAAAAGAAFAAYMLTGSSCGGDPFSNLHPLIRSMWFEMILEGQPLWRQSLQDVGLSLLPSLIGLAGAVAALNRDDAEKRQVWMQLLLLQAMAFAVSLAVYRTLYLSHAFAAPGTAWLILALAGWAVERRTGLGRSVAASLCVIAIPQVAVLMFTLFANTLTAGSKTTPQRMSTCFDSRAVRQLDQLPPALLFAPLDVGPAILVNSRHSVVATPHHRNMSGMLAVISGFTSTPKEAEAIVRTSGVRYLVYCAGLLELTGYASRYPSSLAARLLAGETPDWLREVPPAGQPYRILEISGKAAGAE